MGYIIGYIIFGYEEAVSIMCACLLTVNQNELKSTFLRSPNRYEVQIDMFKYNCLVFAMCHYCRRNMDSQFHARDKVTVQKVNGSPLKKEKCVYQQENYGHCFLGCSWCSAHILMKHAIKAKCPHTCSCTRMHIFTCCYKNINCISNCCHMHRTNQVWLHDLLFLNLNKQLVG